VNPVSDSDQNPRAKKKATNLRFFCNLKKMFNWKLRINTIKCKRNWQISDFTSHCDFKMVFIIFFYIVNLMLIPVPVELSLWQTTCQFSPDQGQGVDLNLLCVSEA
jgi:hypothetical protein